MKQDPRCHICIHKDVCALKSDYLEVYYALDELQVKRSDGKGNVGVTRVEDMVFLELQPPVCSYFHHEVVQNQFSFANYAKRAAEACGIPEEVKE